MHVQTPESGGSVLVVDDDPAVLSVVRRLLARDGHAVEATLDPLVALAFAKDQDFDVVLTDLSMVGMDGIELLRQVRMVGKDVPFILMTGRPSLDSAIRAVEFGAARYICKPFSHEELRIAVSHSVQLTRMARLRRQATDVARSGLDGNGEAERTEVEDAIRSLVMHYQPIVNAENGNIFGYESLMRPQHSRLRFPDVLLDAAARVQRLGMLGMTVRALAPRPLAGMDAVLFINLHADDLMDEDLYRSNTVLAQMADRVVLEITERAPLHSIPNLGERSRQLRDIGFRLALDDLGAGYAGLGSFAALEPEYVKLDISLVSNVHRSVMKQKLVQSFTLLCRDMGIGVVAEGVETMEERECVRNLGVNLLQGYLLARPGPPFPQACWEAA